MDLRGTARRLGGRPLAAYRRRLQRPVLSVVVPVHDVAAYLPAALDSVLSQTLKDLEVIVVDDGSTDASPAILREYAGRDYRVRVLTQANAGQGAARNTGVALARGEFLTFMDSDDVLPPDAYEAMVAGLRASGSDFSVGNLRRLRHGELSRMIWSRIVHREDRIGVTIEEFPAAMQDIIACNRMLRTDFWRERVGDFATGRAYEDHVPMLAAYVRARRFDVLQRVTYHWRIREDQTSTGQQKARIQNLRDRVAVLEEAHELLRAEAGAATYAAWVGRVLEVDLTPYLPFAVTGDAEYRALLASTYRLFLGRVTREALSQVRVATRVRAHLAAAERWDDLVEADDWLREVQNLPPTRVAGGVLVADFPASCAWSAVLPEDQRWMAPVECHFEGAVEHLVWGPDALAVTGWAWLRGLHMSSPTVTARLVGPSVVEVPVQSVVLPEADAWSPLSFASPAGGGFVARVPLTAVRRGSWSLEVTLSQEGLTSTGRLHGQVARSAAVNPGSGVVGGLDVVAGFDPATGLTLHVGAGLAVDGRGRVRGPGVEVERAEARDGELHLGPSLSVPLLAADGRPVPPGVHPLDASLAPGFAGHAPHRVLTEHHSLQVGQRPGGRAVVVIGPPLRPDEVGQVNVQRLRSAYAASTAAVGDLVLLDGDPTVLAPAWEGRSDVVWAVADHSVAVPGRRVLRGSAAWYEVLATARLAVLDRDLGPWAVPRAGQRRIRVFDPDPLLPLGVDAWRAEGVIEYLVDREVRHRHREWDVLAVCSPEQEAALRAAYRWGGQVVVVGSPAWAELVG